MLPVQQQCYRTVEWVRLQRVQQPQREGLQRLRLILTARRQKHRTRPNLELPIVIRTRSLLGQEQLQTH